MSHYFPADEAPSERLLLITLEAPRYSNSEFRHLRAIVVRRAMGHVAREDVPGRLWYDDEPEKVSGYRNATWGSDAKNAMYVAGLAVRGQIDVRRLSDGAPTRDGKPYGNEVKFRDLYEVDARLAKKMERTFHTLDKRYKSLEERGYTFNDSFADQCRRLMLALGIKHALFVRDGYGGDMLELTSAFRELGMTMMDNAIDRLIDKAHGS